MRVTEESEHAAVITHPDLLQKPGSCKKQANLTLNFLGKMTQLFDAQLYQVSKPSILQSTAGHLSGTARPVLASSQSSTAADGTEEPCVA